jgi:hypothetical protein
MLYVMLIMLIVTSLFFNKDRRPTKVLSDNFFSNYGIRSANENKKLFPKVGVM